MFATSKGSVIFCLYVLCVFLTKTIQIAECSPINEAQLDDLAIKYPDLFEEGIESVEQAQKKTNEVINLFL